ncbi:geranylgeranyl pyrophosphate synthase [Carbonactinospora thermoautotrophica]|uniref:polyprenyl synthetase family protein n=1 Tax=Carbonactinospora thermoautotrophica TaxID=1469144 RepID=UPI00226F7D46|nr:polyprenyl synthetase family protein [Carbonactinospora thermoautotrophica]MCX9190608.1 geranylgeranyl pyrophosphate synthase [Carbonactinospora thermoautotrophica]
MTAAGPFGLITSDQALLDDITQGLAAVEEMLRDATKSSYDFITQASQHLMNAGGKRFRPLLVLLAAQFGDKHAPGVVPAAVVVEITHLATLYHDDVMDEAPLRRGVRSVNSQWNNSVAILTGDFLFARASDILADLGPEAVRIQARTFERLVTGQIRESMGPGSDDDPIEHYLSVVADKTGSLIATSGRFGAMLSGADETVVDIMTNFGERIGVAFQLSDDLLDVASDSAQSGKTPGTDLREGVPTLPVLYAKASQDPGDARLRELLDGDLTDDACLAEALDLLRAHPAMDAARRELRRYAESARELLAPLPDIPAKAALAAICDQVVNRTG